MRVLKQIELSETLADSPFFRQALFDHETTLKNAARQIEAVEALFRKLVRQALKLHKANLRLSTTLSTFEVVTTRSSCDANAENAFKKASAEIEKCERKRKESIESAAIFYLRPLSELRERISYILRKEAEEFEAASKRYYAALKKNLAVDPRQTTAVKLSDACIAGKLRKFHIAAMQYVWQLQCVGERIKVDFIETVNEFVGSWTAECKVEQSVADSLKSAADEIRELVQAMKNRLDLLDTKSARMKEAYLCTMAPNSMPNPSASNNDIIEGYVFVLNSFLRHVDCRFTNRLSVSWSRQYAIYSAETRVLTLIPAVPASKSAVEASLSSKVTSCCPSPRTDMRFCFDVMFADKKPQMITIQAVSAEDFRIWTNLMGKAEWEKAVIPA